MRKKYPNKPKSAVKAIIKIAWEETEKGNKFCIATIGPCTNLALALWLEPELASMIHKCYVMGGTNKGYGNITLTAEYNFWADPEAIKVVWSEIPFIHILPWEVADENKLVCEKFISEILPNSDQIIVDDKVSPAYILNEINRINMAIDGYVYCCDGLAIAAAIGCLDCYPDTEEYRI